LANDLSIGFGNKSDLAVPSFNSIENSGYQLSTVLGGKYRSNPMKDRFFIDLGWQPGFKKYKYKYIRYLNEAATYIPDGNECFTNISLSLTMNYMVYKGLYFGIGLMPTASHNLKEKGFGKPKGSNLKFSMPAVYRIGYDFDKVDMSVSHVIDFADKNKSGFRFNLLAPFK
jgi:hypothetical protein